MKYVYSVILAAAMLLGCSDSDRTATGDKPVSREDSIKRAEDSVKHARDMASLNDSANFTSIEWIDSLYQELKPIKEGTTLNVTWRFRNTGNRPLIIADATTSCGCTVSERPEAPVPPGATGEIKATFNSAGKPQRNEREVFVTANTKPSTQHTLAFGVMVQ